MVEITGFEAKKYLFCMNKGYDRIEFIFDNLEEGAEFMFQAMEHSKDEIKFTISSYEEKEGEEDAII